MWERLQPILQSHQASSKVTLALVGQSPSSSSEWLIFSDVSAVIVGVSGVSESSVLPTTTTYRPHTYPL